MEEPASPLPQENELPQMPSRKVSKKTLFLVGAVFIVFVFFLFSVILSFQVSKKSSSKVPQSSSPSVVSPTARRWQILLSYNSNQKDLELKSIAIEKGEAAPINVTNSSYLLQVFDKNSKKIYETPLAISEAVLYNIYVPPSAPDSVTLPKQPRQLDTSITVPYLSAADSIKVSKNNTVILEFAPPKDNAISLIQQAFADSPVCQALSVLFISDGYTDKAKFESDALKVQNTLTSVAPYDTNKEVFNFKTVWTTTPIGCTANGQLNSACIISSQTQTAARAAAGSAAETAFTKYIILTDTGPEVIGTIPSNGDTSKLPKILGAASAAGGDYTVIQVREYASTSAVHEIGGHAIGQLYDRYVDDVHYAGLSIGPHSNCSDSATVHDGWTGASYKGCTKSSWYAPAPTADPVQFPMCGGGGFLVSGGSPDTVMSAAGCFSSSTPKFDTAETSWINTVLKNNYKSYQACVEAASAATPTPSSASVTVSPAAGTQAAPAPMATKIEECPVKPAAGSPGTVEPETFKPIRDPGNNDPDIFFGHYKDSFNKNDLYYTAGQANVEARFAGSNSRNAANPEYRGMFYVRAGKPGGIERAGGYVYDPAYDWATLYGEGSYGETGWSHVMAWTGDAEKGAVGGSKDRNCLIAVNAQRLIRDDKNNNKQNQYYTASKIWYRVPTRPAPPASEPNSVIKIHATGAGFSGGNYPTMALYIDQFKVKTWKNFGKNPAPSDSYIYPDPNDPADANVRIGKVEPHRIIVGMDDSKFNDDDGVGKVNSMVLYGIDIDGKSYPSIASTTFRATTYVDKLQSCVAVQGKEFDHSETGGWFWCGYFWFDYANALKDPYTSPTLFRDISADGSKGTGTVGGESNGTTGAGSSKSSQQYYSCSPDPACKAGNLGVQLCALKCVPK